MATWNAAALEQLLLRVASWCKSFASHLHLIWLRTAEPAHFHMTFTFWISTHEQNIYMRMNPVWMWYCSQDKLLTGQILNGSTWMEDETIWILPTQAWHTPGFPPKTVRGGTMVSGGRILAGVVWDHHPRLDGETYPLVNVYVTMENHHFEWVNPL